jgi:hypothetical protein
VTVTGGSAPFEMEFFGGAGFLNGRVAETGCCTQQVAGS